MQRSLRQDGINLHTDTNMQDEFVRFYEFCHT